MLVLSAEALPLGLVGILYHNVLDGSDGLGLPAVRHAPDAVFKAHIGSGVDPVAVGENDEHLVRVDEPLEQCADAGHTAGVADDEPQVLILVYTPAEAVALIAFKAGVLAVIELPGSVHQFLLL